VEGEGANHVLREAGVIVQVFHALGNWRGAHYGRLRHHVYTPANLHPWRNESC